jgi:VWFA-related protein
VQVTDAKGQPVRGLQEQDFTVLDDKQRQKIVSFHAVTGETASSPEPPVAIVLVVDAVNTSPSTLGYVRDGLDKFLLRNDGRLVQPMSLLFFSREGTAMPPDSSRDGKALAALCDRYQAGLASLNNRSQGLYGDGERFDMSLRYLSSLVQYEQPRPGRKLVLWFSHGWPMLTSPAFQFSSRNR